MVEPHTNQTFKVSVDPQSRELLIEIQPGYPSPEQRDRGDGRRRGEEHRGRPLRLNPAELEDLMGQLLRYMSARF